MSLHNKIIAITGGASGIGLATAKLLSRRGATLSIADNSASALTSTAAYFSSLSPPPPAPVSTHLVNVSSSAAVDAWIAEIVQTHGRLDGAANCAGVIGQGHGVSPLTELGDGEWDRIVGVNLSGCMFCLRAELRVLSEGGSVVNVASIQGVMGFANHAAYSASKHGVVGLTRSAAKEMGGRNIRVNALAPGAIATPLMAQADAIQGNNGVHDEPSAIRRLGTPEEMANIIAFFLGDESRFVTGSVWTADGGWAC